MPTVVPDKLLLLSPADEPRYTTALVLHSISIVVFGIGALIPSSLLMRVEDWWEAHRELPTWVAGGFVYAGFALAILVYFAFSITAPKYQTYLDADTQNLIKRHTHLLQPGVVHETIPFSDVEQIFLGFKSGTDKPECYVNLVLREGREVEIVTTARRFGGETLVGLAHSMSIRLSAPFDEPEGTGFC